MTSPREVVPIIMKIVKPGSVLDVGCGIGTWLKAFEEQGVNDYTGVDGDYVDRAKLKIPTSKFVPFDISLPLDLQRSFDLVVSLEVAEHLTPEAADIFVESLVRHGKTILFSAAIPGQGGQNHVNEQWPEYWQEKFMKHGFYFHDPIRPLIWNDAQVEWWYKQNIFLITTERPTSTILTLVHPQQFEANVGKMNLYRESLVNGKQGLSIAFRILINSIRVKLMSLFGLDGKTNK